MSDYPDSDFIEAAARAAEQRASGEQAGTESEPLMVNPVIEVRTLTDASDSEGAPLGGLMRLQSGPISVSVMLSFSTVAEMVATFGKVLAHKATWDSQS